MTNQYLQQAKKFLEETQTELVITYLRTASMPWDNEQQGRDIYNFTLTRGKRSYSSDFGQSIIHSGKYQLNGSGAGMSQDRWGRLGHKTWYKPTLGHVSAHDWIKNKNFSKPNAYNILACLNPFMYSDNVDDFAYELGYTKPSEALRVFEACKAESDGLQKMYSDEECEQLAEIC